jgi:hypothetical protein
VRRLRTALSLVLAAGVGSAAFAQGNLAAFRPGKTTIGPAEVAVPVRRLGDLLLVGATVNGRGPFTFLVDTGAGATFVSRTLAENLPGKGPVYTKEKDGSDRKLGEQVEVKELALGGALFKNFRALAVDLGDLERATGMRIDGLLGFSLFADCLLTLDYPGSRLRLRTGKLPRPDGGEILPVTLMGGAPHVEVGIGEARITALLDSGSFEPVTLPRTQQVPLSGSPVPGPLMAGVTGRHRSDVGRIGAAVRLGRHEVQRPVVYLRDAGAGIGAPILKHFTLTFDNASQAVELRREGQGTITVQSPRTIGAGFIRKPEGWEVVDVIPGTAAASAGIAVGDVVVAVGGQSVASIDYTAWLDLLNREASVSLELLRGGNRTPLTLPVTELVPKASS